MNKQIKTIYNDLSTAGWNIFTSTQCKIDTAEHLANLGYRKANDVVREIFAEIDKLIYRYMNYADYTIGDMVLDIVELKKKYESEEAE